jgi:hypothetical protein
MSNCIGQVHEALGGLVNSLTESARAVIENIPDKQEDTLLSPGNYYKLIRHLTIKHLSTMEMARLGLDHAKVHINKTSEGDLDKP